MKIAIVGCGGIGGVMAACLTRAGADLTPIVGNPAIARALATHGFHVRDLDGTEWSVPVARPPLIQAEGAARFDLVILTTQSTTLERALTSVAPHLAEGGTVLVCQNGLPEERAAALVGRSAVLGCVVGWGASMVAPGRYQRTSQGGLQLGRPFPESPDAAQVARLLEAASPAAVVEDLAGVRWSKLAINCVTTTLGAIGGARLGRLLVHRSNRRLALEVFSEVAAVAAASAVRLSPVGGTFQIGEVAITDPERAAPLGSPSLAYKHSLILAVGIKYRRLRSSMLYALERGRPPEIDYLNAEIVRRGAALGVPVPINAALVDAVHAIARGEARSSVATLRRLHDEVVPRRARQAA